jgi:hypothetical protein
VLSRHTIEALEKEITFQISVGLFSGEMLKSVVTGQSGFNFTCGCRCRRFAGGVLESRLALHVIRESLWLFKEKALHVE